MTDDLVTTGPISDRALAALDDLRRADLNFDPDRIDGEDWTVDHLVEPLGREPLGPPEPHGLFTDARQVVADYAFADPSIVAAAWDPDEPLDGRTIVLEGRFLVLRFTMGLRVCDVLDTTEVIDGRSATRWGWSYSTLEGHLERGRMWFEVRKWHDTGEVEFRIDAVSQRATIPNPVVRLGMRVFGRYMQHRYGATARSRMRRLVGTTGE